MPSGNGTVFFLFVFSLKHQIVCKLFLFLFTFLLLLPLSHMQGGGGGVGEGRGYQEYRARGQGFTFASEGIIQLQLTNNIVAFCYRVRNFRCQLTCKCHYYTYSTT